MGLAVGLWDKERGMGIEKRSAAEYAVDGGAAIPSLLHFYGSEMSAAEVEALHGGILEPHEDGLHSVFRNGEVELMANATEEFLGKGIAHGGLSLFMDRDGETNVEKGKWIAVDVSEDSEAEKEVVEAFKALQKVLDSGSGETSLLQVIQALEIVLQSADGDVAPQ